MISLAWDGKHEEGVISRPGFKYPYVYVLQPDGDQIAWAVMTQGNNRSKQVAIGHAETVEAAREAAKEAVA